MMQATQNGTDVPLKIAGFSIQRIDTGEPDVTVTGTVRAPIDVVWQLFRPFGREMMRWWPIYEWVEILPPGIDEVGAIRRFKANGRTYEERLVYRDDEQKIEQYALTLSEAPIPIKHALTTVTFKAAGPMETVVTWSSKTDANPLFLPVIKHGQRVAYHGAIESLARYFNPATAMLELKVVSAQVPALWGLLPPNAYVSVQLGSEPPQRTWLRPLTTHPTYNETLHFNLGVLDRRVSIAAWDARLGPDVMLGSAHVDLQNLGTDWSSQIVPLEGPLSGHVELSMRKKPEFQLLRETMTLAKTLGSSLGSLVPPLAQLGFEIGVLDTTVAGVELRLKQHLQSMGLQLPSKGNGHDTNLPGTALLDFMRVAGSVQRSIQGLAEQFMALAKEIALSVQQGELETYTYARYDAPFHELPRQVKGLPLQEILQPAKLSGMVNMGLEFVYSEVKEVERYIQQLVKLFEGGEGDPFQAIFYGYVKRPDAIVDNWKDDVEFCRQLIQGINPMVLRAVRSMTEIPLSMQTLSAQGKSLQALIDEERLFILDYAGLAPLKPYRNMVFYAPIVLVYRELMEDGPSRLNLVGIQLTRNEGLDNVVYTAATTPPNRYLYAKIQVCCADNQYHQWISHLGFAHLAMEPLCIAHHNVFDKPKNRDHKIGKLLAPHLRETIGINYLARQTLVAAPEVAFTDRTFSTGTVQALELFLAAWKKYDFFKNSFPEELAERGFDEHGTDGVENYYYRDDGFKIWRALEAYAKDVVEATYATDREVIADAVLQRWAVECSSPDHADFPGFPRAIVSRAQLVKVLTTIIFQASAFHSAVNFSQRQYISYVPMRPDSTFAEMPPGEGEITMDFILLNGLPNFFISNFQVSFAHLLTLPSDAPLSKVPPIEETGPFKDIHARFMTSLAKISAEIQSRDDALVAAGKQPYPYLNPSRIASSVAI